LGTLQIQRRRYGVEIGVEQVGRLRPGLVVLAVAEHQLIHPANLALHRECIDDELRFSDLKSGNSRHCKISKLVCRPGDCEIPVLESGEFFVAPRKMLRPITFLRDGS
jgi:hypothetical protein